MKSAATIAAEKEKKTAAEKFRSAREDSTQTPEALAVLHAVLQVATFTLAACEALDSAAAARLDHEAALRALKRAEEGRAKIASLEAQYQGKAVKVYNAVLGYCIIHSPRGFEMFNEFGYAGHRATQAEAEAAYEQAERANSQFCQSHNC